MAERSDDARHRPPGKRFIAADGAKERLRRENPRLAVTRISAFGQDGPYRDYEATGIVLKAMGGPMHATGEASRAPQRKPGLLEHYAIGRTAGEATLAGVFFARQAGAGAVVDVSGQEVLLAGADRRASYLLSAAYSGANAPRGMRSASVNASNSRCSPLRTSRSASGVRPAATASM